MDILVPAAIEGMTHAGNADRLKVRADIHRFRWKEARVNKEFEKIMKRATRAVVGLARARDHPPPGGLHDRRRPGGPGH